MRKWTIVNYEKTCEDCGKEFITTSRNHKNIHYCNVCVKKHRREYNARFIKNKRHTIDKN
jgi:hypothetical protein